MRPRSSFRSLWAVVLGLGFFTPAGLAQVKGPAVPESFDATIRYRIRADRDGRILQYRAMEKNLAAAGFKPADPDAGKTAQFDPSAELLTGTVTGSTATKLLEDPRVQTVLLVPTGSKLPDDGAAPVQIRLTLSGNLALTEQRLLHDQAVARLTRMGFRENVGYDHAGFTRVRGSIPAKVVPTLVKDLRDLPTGWFAADVPRDAADLPFRAVLPVRIVEVLPTAPDTSATLPAEPPPSKITADARAVMAQKDRPVRVELVLTAPLYGNSKDLRDRIRLVAPTALLEGIAGNVVTVRADTAADIEAIARFAEVRHVRAPRAAAETAGPATSAVGSAADWFANSNVTALHDRGYRGAGSKVVVLGTEFAGAEALIGKQLPRATTLLDLTGELNFLGTPAPANPADSGAGIAAAVAAAAAAPEATFVLVRVDAAAFHQLLTVARSATGDRNISEGLRSKVDRYARENEALLARRKAVMAEYTAAAADLSDNPKSVKRRADALAAMKVVDADQATFQAAFDRLKAVKKALDDLAGADVIINTLAWDAGRAGDGLNPLQPLLEERFVPPAVSNAIHPGPTTRPPLWVQAASGAVGSVWAGAARDIDVNGVMEFAPPGTPLPAATWTSELNFLAVRGPDGKVTDTLPAGAKIRLSLQWHEPQDPEISSLEPNIQFRIRLLRQIDPTGAKASSDELIEVARSAAEPVRLHKSEKSGVYELTLDASVPADGRYAVRVDYSVPALTVIRARQVKTEIYPRLTVGAADAATAANGRIVFTTFAPADAGAGVPGDSHVALTVGTEEPGLSLTGAGPGMGLRIKPDVLARGVVEVNGKATAGPAVSAGYVGGIAACVRGTGATAVGVLRQQLEGSRGGSIVLPKEWVEALPKKE
jgi:hypothetical protein